MPHRYRVTVEHLADPPAEPGLERSLTFEAVNHDDLLEIVERVKGRDFLPRVEVAEFAIGLKLFGEILLRHRRDLLFAELWPHFGNFIKRLKQGS